jgi:hypothetical protein
VAGVRRLGSLCDTRTQSSDLRYNNARRDKFLIRAEEINGTEGVDV